jgi:retron-type reverse transcriptase
VGKYVLLRAAYSCAFRTPTPTPLRWGMELKESAVCNRIEYRMAHQLSLFDISQKEKSKIDIGDLFEAYYSCRSNKRNTINALAFEIDYESNLIKLCNEINTDNYKPGRSIAFIVNKPVKREIFAADFKDRVVHHFIINKLNPLFEKEFIYDSYACRVGKGTHFGIKRADRFLKSCSKNYTTDGYILKLDVQGFFMHIDKQILFERLQLFINQKYHATDKALLIDLCSKIIFNDPTENCIIKGSKINWEGLPHNKSLFHSPPNCGLPIGNLTSQVFANFYMNSFDHFIKNEIGIRYYGRYVDDLIFLHQDREYLKSLLPIVAVFLKTHLHLTLHPRKIYLQHYTKGVQFLGVVIKPNRVYIANKTKGNFYAAIQIQNGAVRQSKPDKAVQSKFLNSMNSYLGIMKHYKTYNLRKRMVFKNLSGWWWNYVYLSGKIAKFVMKTKTIHQYQACQANHDETSGLQKKSH